MTHPWFSVTAAAPSLRVTGGLSRSKRRDRVCAGMTPKLEYCPRIEASGRQSCKEHKGRSDSAHDAGKDFDAPIATIVGRYYSSADGIRGQGGNRHGAEEQTLAHPNLLDRRDLGDESGAQGDEGARGESEECGKGDQRCVAGCWNPHGEDENRGHKRYDDEDVESPQFVRENAGNYSSKQARQQPHQNTFNSV